MCEEKKVEANASVAVENKIINVDEVNDKKASPSIPCIDRLREELSCAVRAEKFTGFQPFSFILEVIC